MDYVAIEYASFAAWPAFEQMDMGTWLLRFAGGYTKRANSVNVLGHDEGSIAEHVTRCEDQYNQRTMPCIFRLLSFIDNSSIEAILDSRGYHPGERSLVLFQALEGKGFVSDSLVRFQPEPWMDVYCGLSGKSAQDSDKHRQMIKSIQGKNLLVVLRKHGQDVSCGLGVICGRFFGIFDIVTHSDHRNRGYGTELISGMLSWAISEGAETAYVQVVAENAPAIRLYNKLGYEQGYEYHYRIQNVPTTSCSRPGNKGGQSREGFSMGTSLPPVG
jgi:ribosomal protein S18 acetylase RimI-like enzyme